jgi:chorismate mutase
MSDPNTDPTIRELRQEISEVDHAILDAMNARIELVARIKRHKADVGLAFVNAARERELVEALDLRNSGPLSAEGLRELYSYLLELTKREVGRDGRPS